MTHPTELWATIGNTDNTEGKGREVVKSLSLTRSTAKRLGRKGYVQGGDCPIQKVPVLHHEGQAYISLSWINIIQPDDEDKRNETRRVLLEETIEKARERGMSEEDIAILLKGPNR